MGSCRSKNLAMQKAVPPPQPDEGRPAPATSVKRNESSSSSSMQDSHESDSRTVHTDDPSEELKMLPSKLRETNRRRLSVSTIKKEDNPDNSMAVDVVHMEAVTEDVETAEIPTKTTDTDKISPGVLPSAGCKRSKLKHFDEPEKELIDSKTGAVRLTTIDMIENLFAASESSYMMLGAPCEARQKGYEDKNVWTKGTLSSKLRLPLDGLGIACKKGLKPESPNQDDFFVVRVDDWGLYGVFDGHGPYGHDVSGFVHRTFPFLILADPEFETDPISAIKKAFRKVQNLLETYSSQSDCLMDCTLSGTTGTVVLHRDDNLYVAHVGDSRSILAVKDESCMVEGDLTANDLTKDHKPTDVAERKRIEASGGEVRRLEGDIPHRVFVKGRMYPGLAMSRALGDTLGAAVGVVCDPDVKIIELDKTGQTEQFVIISTDGVWEFISSQEAIDLVSANPRCDAQKCAEILACESWKRWVEEEGNVVDDVTCIIFWLH